jgi:hypothetical protein
MAKHLQDLSGGEVKLFFSIIETLSRSQDQKALRTSLGHDFEQASKIRKPPKL